MIKNSGPAHVSRLLALAAILTAACSGRVEDSEILEQHSSVAEAASGPSLLPSSKGAHHSCFSADSARTATDALVFSNVEVAEETYDATGDEFSFFRTNENVWTGTMRTAEGELGNPVPLLSLALDLDSASVKLSYSHGDQAGTVGQFEGHISCDSIYGYLNPYPGVTVRRSYLRVTRTGELP